MHASSGQLGAPTAEGKRLKPQTCAWVQPIMSGKTDGRSPRSAKHHHRPEDKCWGLSAFRLGARVSLGDRQHAVHCPLSSLLWTRQTETSARCLEGEASQRLSCTHWANFRRERASTCTGTARLAVTLAATSSQNPTALTLVKLTMCSRYYCYTYDILSHSRPSQSG